MTKTLVSALALIAMVGAASASTLTNDDKTAHKVNFMPKHGKLVHVSVKAGKDWTFDCSKGGTLMLGKAKQACDAKTGTISIKNSRFIL